MQLTYSPVKILDTPVKSVPLALTYVRNKRSFFFPVPVFIFVVTDLGFDHNFSPRFSYIHAYEYNGGFVYVLRIQLTGFF